VVGLAASVAGCSVSHVGLGDTPDATVDVPADHAPPVVDVGPDLACGACDGMITTFVKVPGGRFMGMTSGASANEGTCGGGSAPETVFKLVLDSKSDLFVTTHGTGFNTVLYLRDGCCGRELACNDDAGGRDTSVLSQRGLLPGTYYIYVDGATSADVGSFTVDIYMTPAGANPGEACGTPLPIAAGATPGNTCGFQDDYSPPTGCSNPAGANGLDQVYYFVLDQKSSETFSTCDSTCIDTVLYLRDVCSEGGAPDECDDDSCRATGSCQPAGNMVQSNLATTLTAGVHYLFLDTFAAAQVPCGDFTITATGIP
jgi:hypothetical protein